MKKAIAIQAIIFIIAYFTMTPDIIEDNTHVFGLFGNVEVIPGNTRWVLLGAAILSAINIWVWWPKKSTTPSEKPAESTKSTEAKAVDPIVPKMD